MPVSSARAAAFDILLRVEREASFASELLHSPAYQNLSTPDHALATEIVMGVLRWRLSLDAEIATASSQPLSRLDLEILIALRIALYQFRHLSRVPQRAALNESVELVKRARKGSAVPFVNAVLRNLSVRKGDAKVVSEETPSPASLAAESSHPLWLVNRWIKAYGPSVARQICLQNQSIPATNLRLRHPNAEPELVAEGVHLFAGSLLLSARRVVAGDISGTQAYRNGHAVIQDEGSQLVAALVGHGSRILDCCAAPGGKSSAISDRNPQSTITAVEKRPHRARLMARMLRTTASTSSDKVHIVVADASRLPLSSTFDRILTDVPCSGTGTLARNPEIKWRLTPEDLRKLHSRQAGILRSAMAQAAPRGRVIYSTCSLEREENEDVVDEVLTGSNSFRGVDCRVELDRLKFDGELVWPDADSLMNGPYLRTIPGVHPCDGFFAAILERV